MVVISGIIATGVAVGAAFGATVAGATAFAIGVATNLVLGAAARALAPKPSVPGNRGYLTTALGSALDHQIIYGKVRTAGVRIYDESTGDKNEYLHRILAFAGHEVESFDQIYLDDEVVTLDGTGNVTSPSRYNGKVRILKKFGGADQTAESTLVAESSKWTVEHRLRGIAYLYVRLEFDGDVFPNGIPEITAVVSGKKVYDPRTDTTVWSDNPALCLRDYLVSPYGLNEDAANVDDALVIASANVCDETVAGGATRYTCNGAFTTASTPYDMITALLTSMDGSSWYSQGQWRMKPAYWTAPVLDLDEGDLRSSVDVSTRHSRRDNFNVVKGTFRGEETNWQITDYPQVTNAAFLAADGGQESVADVDLPFTDNSVEARRIARISLERNRQQITVSASFGLRTLEVQVGDNVRLTNSRFGWVNKEFEVVSWDFGLVDGLDVQTRMVLRETAESIFDEVSDGIAYERDNTTLPSPFDGLSVSGLSVSGGGKTQGDGTFVNSAIFSWTPVVSSFLAYYEVEWKPVADTNYSSTTTTENSIELSPVVDGIEYVFRVRAVTLLGNGGTRSSITYTVGGDVVAPALPTAFSATGTLGFINLVWTNPADVDFSHVEVFESTTNSFVDAVSVNRSFGNTFNRGNLAPLTTRYYWIRSVDLTGNASNVVGPVSATTRQIEAADIGPAVIQYDDFASDVTDIFDDIQLDLSNRVLTSDYNITVDYQQQLEDATNQLSIDALDLALRASSLETRINDAGITVDPATGSVVIQGLATVNDRVNEVEIDLNAVEASLTLTASVTYVNDQIAAATLPEASLASLVALEARVDTVEIDLDAVEGAITLTSTGSLYNVNDSVLGVEALEGRITVAENEIDLQVTAAEFDDVETRLSSAEVQLSSIDAPSITFSVQEIRSIANKQVDLSELTLQEVLNNYKNRESSIQELAFARQSLAADINENGEAIATLSTELNSKVDQNTASILTESSTRANADSALASDITQLDSQLTAIDGEVSANASAVSGLTTRVTDAEGIISAQASSINSLSTTVGNNTTSITQAATSIDGIEGKYGVEIDNNGSITGYQLLSGVGGSAFNVRADQFAIFDSNGAGGDNPFTVFTTSRTIGGVVYPAGTYIRDAYIDNLSVVDGSITNAKIGSVIQSSNYSAGNTGWKIEKDGSAEFNGPVISRNILLKTTSFNTSASNTQNNTVFEWVNTGIRVGSGDFWAGNVRTLIAVAKIDGGASIPSGANLDNAFFGLECEVVNGAKWFGYGTGAAPTLSWQKDPSSLITPSWATGTDQRIFLRIRFNSQNGVFLPPNTSITLKVYEVT